MLLRERAPVSHGHQPQGGVGKTHTAWLLTGVCAERGTRLLAMDCDTQANLSRSLLDDRDTASGLEVLFHPGAETDPSRLIRRSRFSSVDILPARPSRGLIIGSRFAREVLRCCSWNAFGVLK